MSTTGYIAFVDGVEADCALEFVLELLGAYFEAVIVEVVVVLILHHLYRIISNYSLFFHNSKSLNHSI